MGIFMLSFFALLCLSVGSGAGECTVVFTELEKYLSPKSSWFYTWYVKKEQEQQRQINCFACLDSIAVHTSHLNLRKRL